MPWAKTNCGQLKMISCPCCGKKFCTETNVLQHMNQPNSSCHGGSLFNSDFLTVDTAVGLEASHFHNMDQPPSTGDLEDIVPSLAPWSRYPWFRWDEDIEMDDAPSNPCSDNLDNMGTEPQQLHQDRFMEMFEGCGERFPGSKTFMDQFKEDQHAEQRRDNIYFPWALKQEWVFVSWLLHSRLSMAAINNLLSLDIVRCLHFCMFHLLTSFRSKPHHCHFIPQRSWGLAPRFCPVAPNGYVRCYGQSILSSNCSIFSTKTQLTVCKLSSVILFCSLISHLFHASFGCVQWISVTSTMNGWVGTMPGTSR